MTIKNYSKVDINDKTINNDFEQMILEITHKPFKIYNQEWAKHYCEGYKEEDTYPDCGEVTARNLINLMCYNGSNFDTKQLEIFEPIPELMEYYRIFNNFISQSSIEAVEIWGEKLNARDAWSKLVIFYANSDLRFIKSCKDENHKIIYNFELNSGMNMTETRSNFSQLIKNLLTKIDNLNEIKTNFIISIKDNTKKGIGLININHNGYGELKIKCDPGHYYMELNIEKNESYDYSQFSVEKQNYIRILLNDNKLISNDNYIYFNLDSNFLVELLYKLKENLNNDDLEKKLINLSLTNKYDSDARRRIGIDTDKKYFVDILCGVVKNKSLEEKINEYNYQSNDLNFVKIMPYLKN